MDAEKIYDILLKFSSNSQRGILIDGSWGIGKTYQINRFLEKIEEDNKNEKDKSKKPKLSIRHYSDSTLFRSCIQNCLQN